MQLKEERHPWRAEVIILTTQFVSLETQKIPNLLRVIGGQPYSGSGETSRDEEVDSNCGSFGGEGAQLQAQRKTVPREVSVNTGSPRFI